MTTKLGVFHIGITRRHVIYQIHQDGAASVLTGWQGTDQEAIEAVQADERDFFDPCPCRKSTETGTIGRCLGVNAS